MKRSFIFFYLPAHVARKWDDFSRRWDDTEVHIPIFYFVILLSAVLSVTANKQSRSSAHVYFVELC
jgi:hypothetical protein